MKTKSFLLSWMGVVVVGVVCLLFFLFTTIWLSTIYNRAATLENTYNMKVKDNSSEFDNTFKKISQTFQIAEHKKGAFREILVDYAAARTPEGAGKVMMWIKENAPAVDLSLYDNTQNIIVSSRDGWTMRQKELVGIAEEYNKQLVQFPGNIILKLFGFKMIDPKVITSTRTEKAFETGKDDDLSLTPKN